MNDHRIRNRFSSLAGIAAQAPQMYELLHRVGLQRRRNRAARMARSAGWFGAGLAVGAGLSSLLSQGGGQQLKERLSTQARKVRDYVAPVEQAVREGAQQRQQSQQERARYQEQTGSSV
jgi:hypothetical protein